MRFDRDGFSKPRENDIQDTVRDLLIRLGEDPEREGLLDTPKRYAKAMQFLTTGYHQSLQEVVGEALFEHSGDDFVLVKDVEFYSLCEHHILPFFGRASVLYIPNGKVVGLSKIPRIVDRAARKLQLQERLTREVAEDLNEILSPKGVIVRVEASHLCMMMRGVEKQKSQTVTQTVLGDFKEDRVLRSEALSLFSQN